jgi:hypothetical protein
LFSPSSFSLVSAGIGIEGVRNRLNPMLPTLWGANPMSESAVQIRTLEESATITELAALAEQIAEAVGFSFTDAADPAESEHLNADGVWEYHFETDDRWGFVAGRPDEMVMTTYPGWNTLVIEPDHAAVFYAGTLVGIISPHAGRIGWYAPPLGSGGYVPTSADLEPAMLAAFRAERDAVAPTEWGSPQEDYRRERFNEYHEQPNTYPPEESPHDRD